MGSIQKEWLIYFYEDGVKNRYFKFLFWLKKGFTHCGALQYNPQINIWLHLQFTHAGIKVDILTPEEVSGILSMLYHFKVLRCPIKDDWHLIRIKELSCVSFIMRLIGFYRWWIITPYQLYCALQKAGYSSFWDKGINHGKKTQNT
jgi:hypothetical protein